MALTLLSFLWRRNSIPTANGTQSPETAAISLQREKERELLVTRVIEDRGDVGSKERVEWWLRSGYICWQVIQATVRDNGSYSNFARS